ncbi:lipopolysaccharide-induced tumor necrosis factor-alpha factor homolog [Teleopsis dalmanni]|uniref:lipopolysaccharide-induced tumor necrosis factor-alpha factor homolog n=1 Tax=Teleopsis dalmanni TaxID=139649 RepID=UPI0018CD57F3|nr:lipopolysaccharide-induced tumor necrosis factor-alpha factor homolog [Teleopsis dalmanni]
MESIAKAASSIGILGENAVELTCPRCQCRVKTTVRYRPSIKTHLRCLLLSWCLCCFLPYCMDSCRDAYHFCPMCGFFIGVKKF